MKGTKAIRVLPLAVTGTVAAGFPSPAEEELRDILSLDEYLIPRPAASFLLKVSGDSMAGAGILAGDLVIVERGREPRGGDIVLAEQDGHFSLRYFHRKGRGGCLISGNPQDPAVSPDAEVRIGGVVAAVIRKY